MENLTILQTCAGGVSAPALTAALVAAGARVIKADMDLLPIAGNGPVALLPSPEEKEKYEDAVKQIIHKEPRIVVYPHNDAEAHIIAAMHSRSECDAFISAPVSLRHTQDKLSLYTTCRDLFPYFFDFQLRSAFQFFSDQILDKDSVYKLRQGCGGQGLIRSCDFPGEKEYIVTSRLAGKEYTLDMLCWRGEILDFCCRERIKTHGGICTDAAIIGGGRGNLEKIDHFLGAPVYATAKILVQHYFLHGPIALQGFVFLPRPYGDRVFCVTDCNHRFGGGAGLSIAAGWKGVKHYVDFLGGDGGKPLIPNYDLPPARIHRFYVEEKIETKGAGDGR